MDFNIFSSARQQTLARWGEALTELRRLQAQLRETSGPDRECVRMCLDAAVEECQILGRELLLLSKGSPETQKRIAERRQDELETG